MELFKFLFVLLVAAVVLTEAKPTRQRIRQQHQVHVSFLVISFSFYRYSTSLIIFPSVNKNQTMNYITLIQTFYSADE